MTEEKVSIQQLEVQRVELTASYLKEDTVAVEAPLEIRIKRQKDPMSKAVAVTMRTPGQDKELAVGFLFTEAIIKEVDQVLNVQQKTENVIEIEVSNDTYIDLKNADRNFYTTSSCGVCGKASIEAIKIQPSFKNQLTNTYSADYIYKLLQIVKGNQSTFELTGGIHASSLFRSSELVDLQEDVGRHNALDKLIGQAFLEGKLPLHDCVLLLSGRASFELIQKAAMAGIPIITAIGAPSSLAIDLAKEHHLTLIGFLKKDRFNIYSGHERIEI
jgi:FdhD protein